MPGVARTGEQQAVPLGEICAIQVETWILVEMRRCNLTAVEVVGPVVDGADDIFYASVSRQHFGLAVTTDVRYELRQTFALDEQLARLLTAESYIVAVLLH